MDGTEEIYTNFKGIESQQNEALKKIRDKITNFRNDSKNGKNTISIETDIEREIKNFKDKVRELENGYSDRNAPTTLIDEELERRRQKIQQMSIDIEEIEKTFKSNQNDKYSFKANLDNYGPTEEVKEMSNDEIMQLNKKKLNEQDDQLGDIIDETVKVKKLNREAQEIIKDQNNELDKMEEDMDKLDSKFQSGIKRFQRYAAKAPTCCIIVILILEIIGAGLILWL